MLQDYLGISTANVVDGRAGLVFLAFGFNLVDCGGLLGGRLGNDSANLKKIKASHGLPVSKRTFTL